MKYQNKEYEILTPYGWGDFTHIQRVKKTGYIKIYFEDETVVIATPNHIFYDCFGEKLEARQIIVDSYLKSQDGYKKVVRIDSYRFRQNFYDILNSGKKNVFFANQLVTHNCNFLGSGDSVISMDIQENIKKNMLKDPINTYHGGKMWQWEEPKKGHRYIMGVDPSRGDSADYSAMVIVDIDEMEVVLEYVEKLPPDDLAQFAYKWGIMYEAMIVVDITGGMGVATVRKLQELNYRNLYTEGQTSDIWRSVKTNDKMPGLNFNNKRVQIIASLEENLRKDFKVYSERFVNELSTFVFINGRPNHMKGCHDDIIMATSMCLYVFEVAFSQLTRNDNKNKAILDAWLNSERSENIKPQQINRNGNPTIDSIGAIGFSGGNYLLPNSNPNLNPQYSWLFNRRR